MKLLYHLFCLSYEIQKWLFKRFTPGGIAILVCLLAAAVVGLDTKQTMAYQIFTFLLATLIIAITFSFYFRIKLKVERTLPRFATVGVKLSYRIALTNESKHPQIGLKFIEEITIKKISLINFKRIYLSAKKKVKSLSLIYFSWLKAISYQKKAKTKVIDLPTLKAQNTVTIKGEITPNCRGRINLSGINILRPDPFNLFNAIKIIKLPQSILVLPKRYQLPSINLPGSRMSQSGSASLASSVGDSEEFIAVREYRPGDPFRKIHWKSWAKTGNPIIKEEQSEYFVRHTLILDNFQPQSQSAILEEAISVAASFACNLHTQESLLDLMFIGSKSFCFNSGRGLGSSEQMLEILAGVSACQDKTFDYLTAALELRLSILSGCICIFIAWDEAREKLIQRLQAAKIPLLILLIAKSEQQYQDLNLENLHVLPLGKIQESLMSIAAN